MELRPEWIALLGALIGALAATVAPVLGGLVTTRHERTLKRREEKLRRFEEVYERLSTLEADIVMKYWRAAHSLLSERPFPKEAPPEFARVDMLIGFYAKEIEAQYREVRNSIRQLYGEYVEWVWVAENGLVGERSEKIGMHTNQWMLASVRVQELKDRLAKAAQKYEL